MKKLKVVVRQDMPETNSSSSHSVVINTKSFLPVKPGDEYWNLAIDNSGYIHVPGNVNFGWEWEKYNDVLSKLQYVAGIFSRGENPQKRLARLSSIVKGFTGAKGVIYDWVNIYNTTKDYDSYDCGAPEKDHNSSDIFPEITESDETIKNFIFNRKSWLFLGNDNSDEGASFYDVEEGLEKQYKALLKIDFGGDIGEVEFPMESYPSWPSDTLEEYTAKAILDAIVFDRATRTAVKRNLGHDNDKTGTMFYMTGYTISELFGEEVVVYGTRDFEQSVCGLASTKGLSKSMDDIKAIVDTRKEDWITIGIDILTDEFGKL